jgi:hypothetical protein
MVIVNITKLNYLKRRKRQHLSQSGVLMQTTSCHLDYVMFLPHLKNWWLRLLKNIQMHSFKFSLMIFVCMVIKEITWINFFKCLKECWMNGINLNLEFFHFVWIQVYFWDIVGSEGLLVDLQFFCAITTMPTPTNVIKIKKLLVAIEFYWHYF